MARWIGGIAVLVCVALFASFKLYERQFRLSHVPGALNVSTVLYANEQSWGSVFFPLPGDNETGLIVYELPDSTAREIQKVGIDYFTKMAPKAGDGRDWHGRYEKWQRTPILLEGSDGGTNVTKSHEIANYLNRYGFGISIDSRIEQEIDKAISRPGSFAAYGRIGILIVMPDIRRVVYAYNG
jgi:hypothetical protein